MLNEPKLIIIRERLLALDKSLAALEKLYSLEKSEDTWAIIKTLREKSNALREEKRQIDRENFEKMVQMKDRLPESVQFFIEDEWNDLVESFL